MLRRATVPQPARRPPRRRVARAAWWLIAPLVVFLLLTLGFPLLADVFYSFTQLTFETLFRPVGNGLANYTETVRDPRFWEALWFSVRFGLTASVVQVLLGLGMALLFQPLLERHRPLLALLLLPMMISPALMAVMYRLILNDFVGVIPRYLQLAGVPPFDLFGPQWGFLTLVTIEVLQWTPFAFLVLYTALQAVPTEVTEAAQIDGASYPQILGRVLLPLMVPALAITAFIRLIDAFRVFDHIYVLTGGGPGTSTTSISIYIYKRFFQENALGGAIASSMLLLLLTLVPLLLLMRLAVRGATRE